MICWGAIRVYPCGAVAKSVQFLSDLGVGHALPSQFYGLRHHIGVLGPQRRRDQLLPRLLGLPHGNMGGAVEHPKRVLVKVIGW